VVLVALLGGHLRSHVIHHLMLEQRVLKEHLFVLLQVLRLRAVTRVQVQAVQQQAQELVPALVLQLLVSQRLVHRLLVRRQLAAKRQSLAQQVQPQLLEQLLFWPLLSLQALFSLQALRHQRVRRLF
jgi:hypothetical protein